MDPMISFVVKSYQTEVTVSSNMLFSCSSCSEFGNKGRAITEGQYREFISEETTSYNICVRIPSQEYTITSLVITRQFILYYIIMPCPSNRD